MGFNNLAVEKPQAIEIGVDPRLGVHDIAPSIAHASGMLSVSVGSSRRPSIPDMLGGMDQNLTALERAFQLAQSGQVTGVADIVTALKYEGYRVEQIHGPRLFAQLRKLIGEARAPRS